MEHGALPGDPLRAKYIAETFFDAGYRQVNAERGMLGYTGSFRGKRVSVQGTGMGCPGATIVFEELIQLGVKKLLRAPLIEGAHIQILTVRDTHQQPAVGEGGDHGSIRAFPVRAGEVGHHRQHRAHAAEGVGDGEPVREVEPPDHAEVRLFFHQPRPITFSLRSARRFSR